MSGAFFESYVFSEIYKSWINDGSEPPFYYYRDKEKREIDLLIYQNEVIYPIEAKKTASISRNAIRSFKALKPLESPDLLGEPELSRVQIGTGAVVSVTNELLPIDDRNWSVPAWLI